MSQAVFKILYCSRNLIQGDQAQQNAAIDQILRSARTNNSQHGVTGALLFNSGCFAQVLEGPQAAIELIFEKIQRDARHGDVTVLTSSGGAQRDFPDWSMAHVQLPSGPEASGVAATLELAMIQPEESGGEVLALLRSLVAQED